MLLGPEGIEGIDEYLRFVLQIYLVTLLES